MQVFAIAAAGGVIGGSVVFLLGRWEYWQKRDAHVHRYLPQPLGEAPRCIDCGKVYR